MTICLILIGIYIFSAVAMWLSVRKSFSKGGEMQDEEVSWFYFFATIVPILNTITLVILTIISADYNKDKFLKKVFNIKK